MALVAYDNSNSSENEDEYTENEIVVTLNTLKKRHDLSTKTAETMAIEKEEITDEGPGLFNMLPQPTNKKPAVIEEDDEFLHKKENVPKPRAKITVPSLSDFKDVGSTVPNAKPKITNSKKSGLLSMLPQPRNAVISTTRSLIPNVLQKPNSRTVKKKDALPLKKSKVDAKSVINDYSDDSENDEEVQNDFFSINKPNDILIEDIPLDIDQPSKSEVDVQSEKKPFNIESYFKTNEIENQITTEPESSRTEYTSAEPTSSYSSNYGEPNASNNGEVLLDDEAILKLCGTRGKRKREDIQIVEVNQKEVLADAQQWLLKGLMDDTSKRVSASKKKGNEPTSQQRRKHQITYLAHQAKANEAELQNQWANNRMSKRQTQSKYGF